MKLRLAFLFIALALARNVLGQSPTPTNLTAFALVKLGTPHVPAQARDKITGIHSERSTNGLIPDTWFVDYYDSTTTFKMTEIKFVAGKVIDVKRPNRLLDTFVGTKQLEWKRIKVDSDRALAIALKQPSLAKADLRAAQYWLQRTPVGSTWKIRFWVAKLGKPGETLEVGDLYISSKNGEILKDALHF